MAAFLLLAATTPPDICAVIETAYAATAASAMPPVATAIVPARGALELQHFVPSYVAAMALKPGEFDDLKAQAARNPGPGFVPDCAWANAGPVPKEDGVAMKVAFTRPVFSSDARLALVEVSFFSDGWWGHGELCMVRRLDGAWRARCLRSWIS